MTSPPTRRRRGWWWTKTTAALSVLGIVIAVVAKPSSVVGSLAVLSAAVAFVAFAFLAGYQLSRTKIGLRGGLIIGGIFGFTGPGAYEFVVAPARPALQAGVGTVSPAFFALLAPVVAGLTLAFIVELRYATIMPRPLAADRRCFMLCVGVGGAVAIGCALAGVVVAPQAVTGERVEPAGGLVAALLGAVTIEACGLGAFLIGLAAFPREGFKSAVEHEERRLAKDGVGLPAEAWPPRRLRTKRPRRYWMAFVGAAAVGTLTIGFAFTIWWGSAIAALVAGGGWLVYGWVAADRNVRADLVVPLHPVTLVASTTVLLACTLVCHEVLACLEPADHSSTAGELYGSAVGLLVSGFVVFASGHPGRRELLPSLNTIGIWCGVALFSAVGLAGALLGAAGDTGWFGFWATVIGLPAMIIQLLVARSALTTTPIIDV